MSTAISSIPTSGTFPVNLAHLLPHNSGSKKRRREIDEVVALRYAFKPASVTTSTPGSFSTDGRKHRSITFDVSTGSQQVFDVKEEASKPRECVLIWDEDKQSFSLHPISTTLNLTLNRSASTSSRRTRAALPSKPPSVASSSSSASVPLAKRPDAASVEEDPSELLVVAEVPRGVKKVKSSSPAPIPRATKGGKSLPRKAPMVAHAPLPTGTPPKKKSTTKKGGTGKRATKAPTAPKGKYKSAEIIEDSEEDYGLNDEGEDDVEDEFAKMVGESLAATDVGRDSESDEEEEEDDDDEADELGGAKVVVRDEGRRIVGQVEAESEWL